MVDPTSPPRIVVRDVDWSQCHVQLTAYGFAGGAKKAETTHKSKQAAIEKYGAIMVAAAERWVGNWFPPYMSIDPYGSLIGRYRAAYWMAMTRKEAKLPKVTQLRTRRPVPELDLACTVRAIQRIHSHCLWMTRGARCSSCAARHFSVSPRRCVDMRPAPKGGSNASQDNTCLTVEVLAHASDLRAHASPVSVSIRRRFPESNICSRLLGGDHGRGHLEGLVAVGDAMAPRDPSKIVGYPHLTALVLLDEQKHRPIETCLRLGGDELIGGSRRASRP